MEGVLAVFAVGTLWWFILSGVWVIWMIWAVDHEKFAGTTIALVLYLLFLQFIARAGMEQVFVRFHPVAVIATVLLYVILGVVWSFIKWWIFINEEVDDLKDKRKSFLERTQRGRSPNSEALRDIKITEDTPVPEPLQDLWLGEIRPYLPSVSDNKSRIALWITYWPLSAVWSLLDDLIHKLAKRIVECFRTWYEAIAKRALKRVGING